MSDPINNQLNRIKGQVGGVLKMYESGRGCLEIVHQIAAVRSSLGRVARDMLSGEATKCSKENRVEDLEKILKELFK